MSENNFWAGMLKAVEVEPRNISSIRGSSGVAHPVKAVGVDDERKRVVIIAQEPNPRAAALLASDIKAALPEMNVIAVRPSIVNLAGVSNTLVNTFNQGNTVVDVSAMMNAFGEWIQTRDTESDGDTIVLTEKEEERLKTLLNPFVSPIENALTSLGLSTPLFLSELLHQLGLIEPLRASRKARRITERKTGLEAIPKLDLGEIVDYDPIRADLEVGICPIPLYNFTDEETESILSGHDIEYTREILKFHDVYQYFFPSADQLALGLIERGANTPSEILEQIALAPEIGHPLGEMEIVESTPLEQLIDALQDRG